MNIFKPGDWIMLADVTGTRIAMVLAVNAYPRGGRVCSYTLSEPGATHMHYSFGYVEHMRARLATPDERRREETRLLVEAL